MGQPMICAIPRAWVQGSSFGVHGAGLRVHGLGFSV